jgi:hypothetical protein
VRTEERFGGRVTAADLPRIAAGLELSVTTLDAIEEQIRARGESPAHDPDHRRSREDHRRSRLDRP